LILPIKKYDDSVILFLMKNTIMSLGLAIVLAISVSCASQRKYEARVAKILSQPSQGKDLAEGMKYLAAQEVSASGQLQ
jgi:hypothetical protein